MCALCPSWTNYPPPQTPQSSAVLAIQQLLRSLHKVNTFVSILKTRTRQQHINTHQSSGAMGEQFPMMWCHWRIQVSFSFFFPPLKPNSKMSHKVFHDKQYYLQHRWPSKGSDEIDQCFSGSRLDSFCWVTMKYGETKVEIGTHGCFTWYGPQPGS